MRPLAFIRIIIFARLLASAAPAVAGGIYTQLVVPFPEVRAYTYAYSPAEHALTIAFKKTTPSEVPAFEQYDERLIKRVVIKDLGPSGTEVKLVLRDREVRASVSEFQEPFRLAIDLFDADYEEEKDPSTGMPIVEAKKADTPGLENHAPKLLTEPKQAALEAAPAADVAATSGARRLLEPAPEAASTAPKLEATLNAAPEGLGKSWKSYPPYIYRLQTAAFEEGLADDRKSSAAKATGSAESMADYAGRLFNFGQESRALLAYQQVLHKDPTLFDRDALHLWKFAETHLGQGNLSLARGYFEALTEKHPESPLAQFARLRVLDIESIELLAQNQGNQWPKLLPKLGQIKIRHAGELEAQVTLRQVWWSESLKTFDPARLPPLNEKTRAELNQAYTQVESARTAFLAASLLLHDLLGSPWQRPTGEFADAYFKRFSGAATEPYRSGLKDELQAKLNSELQAKVASGKLLEATNDYEALPKALTSIRKTPKTAWALAEAYRKLGQAEKSLELYAVAAKSEAEGPDRFKALYWLSVTAGEAAMRAKEEKAGADRVQSLTRQSHDADQKADAAWQGLKDAEREQLAIAYKEPFEKSVTSPAKLKTGPKIVLSNWTKALTTKTSTQSGGAPSDWARNFSPTASSVALLTDLGKRFAELGLADERRQALSLLKHLKPKTFDDDKNAKTIWANQLVDLAEEYRRSNQYLDAGRLYAQVGDESENWEGRAEALYKGGLLLYRAGRREEAVQAFKKASEDGNNLFYANLAKERLSQLQ